MDALDLKLLCFQIVFDGLQCAIAKCENSPMAFLIVKDEKCLLCQKHFEIAMYLHDGLECYYTHNNGGRPFKVYVGEATAYIYRNTIEAQLIKRYIDIEQVFLGTNVGMNIGNTILLKLGSNKYVYVGEQVVEFEIEDEITEFHSYIGANDVPYPVAVGTTNIYFGPTYCYYPRSAFPKRTTWEKCWPTSYKEFLSSELREELGTKIVIQDRLR